MHPLKHFFIETLFSLTTNMLFNSEVILQGAKDHNINPYSTSKLAWWSSYVSSSTLTSFITPCICPGSDVPSNCMRFIFGFASHGFKSWLNFKSLMTWLGWNSIFHTANTILLGWLHDLPSIDFDPGLFNGNWWYIDGNSGLIYTVGTPTSVLYQPVSQSQRIIPRTPA